jgi:hypothetical protein
MDEQPRHDVSKTPLQNLIDLFGGTIIATSPPQAFKIAPGTLVSVCKSSDSDRQWKPHTTKIEAVGVRIGGSSGAIVLRVGDWLVLTRQDQVSILGS